MIIVNFRKVPEIEAGVLNSELPFTSPMCYVSDSDIASAVMLGSGPRGPDWPSVQLLFKFLVNSAD